MRLQNLLTECPYCFTRRGFTPVGEKSKGNDQMSTEKEPYYRCSDPEGCGREFSGYYLIKYRSIIENGRK